MSSGGLFTRYFTGGLGGFLRFFRVRSSGFPVSPFPLFSSLLPEVVLPSSVASESLSESLSESVGRLSSGGFRWLGIGLYVRFAVEPFKTMDFILKSSHSLIQAGIILKKTGIILSETGIIFSETGIIFSETGINLSETANILKK